LAVSGQETQQALSVEEAAALVAVSSEGISPRLLASERRTQIPAQAFSVVATQAQVLAPTMQSQQPGIACLVEMVLR